MTTSVTTPLGELITTIGIVALAIVAAVLLILIYINFFAPEAIEELTADEDVCENAQTFNLCDGLDLTYGDGYREICCGDYNLCC